MPNYRHILHSSVQRMGAFLFSWDALIFCLFCLLSAGFWFFRNYNHRSADYSENAGSPNAIVYTEKTVQVQIRATGAPAGEQLIVFPDHVTVVARVTLEEYNNLSANDFYAECRYPKSDQDRLKVEVSCENEDVASFKFSPEEVEYIIEKRENP